jgi:membrane-associated phospholipid phosphatase
MTKMHVVFGIALLVTVRAYGQDASRSTTWPSQPIGDSDHDDVIDAVAHAANDETAQQPSEAPPTPLHTGLRALFHNVVEDLTKLPATQNLYIAAVGGAAALAVHPADPTFNGKLMSHSSLVNNAFAPGQYVGGSYEQVAGALATYAFGRLFDEPKVSHLGNDLLQAQILSEIMIEPLKLAVHRLRPYQVNSCGLNCSFPSGHASVTFADATVIERHLGWRYSIIGYAIASYVAMSRLHDNQHFASDVVFGSAVGTIAGRTVVHHARDYWAMAPVALPGGGVALVVTRVRPQ